MIRSREAVKISSPPSNNRNRGLVLIVAGEASADQHGANLVRVLRRLCPDVVFCGIGGLNMAQAGVRCFVDSDDMAVVGLTEIMGKFKTIVRASNILKSVLEKHRPDLLILIDYPGFNLRMARIAKRYRVPVLYYISPQVWAWRRGRVKKIAKRVDRMAVILPFEKPFLERSGIRVDYVGHPLMDVFEKKTKTGQTKGLLEDFPSGGRVPTVAMVPGSRREEISNLLPVMLEAGEMLQSEYSEIRFVLPLAESISLQFLQSFLKNSPITVEVRQKGIYEALTNCHLAFVTSGTATLDAAIMGVPMVIVYKARKLTYEIGKRVIKVPYLGLVNLVSQERVAPELIQEEATAENLVREARRFLNNASLRQEAIRKLGMVKKTLGRGGASARTAHIAAEMLRVGCQRSDVRGQMSDVRPPTSDLRPLSSDLPSSFSFNRYS